LLIALGIHPIKDDIDLSYLKSGRLEIEFDVK